MQLRNWLVTHCYHRKSLLDPTHNYSVLPTQLVNQFSGKTILNIGAGAERVGEGVITLDLFSGADIKGDAMHLPITSNSVDLVLSIAVLEHLPEPVASITEMYRILKPGGHIYIEIPFLQPFHSSPHDYYRATLPGLKHWCRHFQHLKSGVCVGPGSSVAWIEIEYIKLWVSNISFLALPIEIIFRLWSLPLKWLDRFIINSPDAHITASAIYFHGQKPKA